MSNKSTAPKAVRQWYSDIGKRGVQGRFRDLNPVQRQAIARAGGLARQKKLRETKQGTLAGTDTASNGVCKTKPGNAEP
jgi:hypothetical protein